MDHFLVERENVPQRKVLKRERKFTLIWLTALTGESVMAVIIIQGKESDRAIEFSLATTADLIGN